MENQNKPAFSVALKDNSNPYHSDAMGLTKREYFAAMRKEPIFGGDTLSLDWAKSIMESEPPKDKLENIKWWISAHEKFAVMRADALLAELEKNPTP